MSYKFTQGEDIVIPHTFTVTTEEGEVEARDLTGCFVWWTLKSSRLLADADAEINHYWSEEEENGISTINPDTGDPSILEDSILYNHITAAETSALELDTHYHYDLWIRDSSGLDQQLETGYVHVRLPVRTRETLAP